MALERTVWLAFAGHHRRSPPALGLKWEHPKRSANGTGVVPACDAALMGRSSPRTLGK